MGFSIAAFDPFGAARTPHHRLGRSPEMRENEKAPIADQEAPSIGRGAQKTAVILR
jgi:hypothetical protein